MTGQGAEGQGTETLEQKGDRSRSYLVSMTQVTDFPEMGVEVMESRGTLGVPLGKEPMLNLRCPPVMSIQGGYQCRQELRGQLSKELWREQRLA